MVKVVFLVHRRPGLSREDFSAYWRESHGQVCRQLPGLLKYVQNHGRVGPDGTDPPFDGFAEMWFHSLDDFERALETPEGRATIDDVANFANVDTQRVMFVDELVVSQG